MSAADAEEVYFYTGGADDHYDYYAVIHEIVFAARDAIYAPYVRYRAGDKLRKYPNQKAANFYVLYKGEICVLMAFGFPKPIKESKSGFAPKHFAIVEKYIDVNRLIEYRKP